MCVRVCVYVRVCVGTSYLCLSYSWLQIGVWVEMCEEGATLFMHRNVSRRRR